VGPVKNEHIAAVLGLFVVFYILTSPEAAASQARQFIGWLGEVLDAAMTFVEGLVTENDVDPATATG
jgi:hypothetical protein